MPKVPSINYDEDDAQANSIVYEVQIETRNYKLQPGQREALLTAMEQVLMELSVKMDLVVGSSGLCRVRGYINTANNGRREMHIPEAPQVERDEAPQMLSIGGVGMKD